LYDEGLRAFYQSDVVAASRLFNAALKEDSNFVLATYFAWRSEVAANGPHQDALADRAVALAASAPERDRLLILAHVSAARSDLGAVVAAESLAARYANDPEALIRAGEVATDLPRVEALLDRAIALDSATGVGPAAVCRLCDAFRVLARRYEWADSVQGVEQTLNRWSVLRPDDYEPWRMRADYLIGLGRSRDADAALRRADSLGAPKAGAESAEATLVRALRLDDVESSNKICGEKLATSDPDEFVRYRGLCTIGLRMQGRYREALGLIRGGRVPWSNVVRGGLPLDRTHAAILDMEMGRTAAAAFAYAAMAADAARSSFSDGYKSRMLAWDLTLSATASAIGGDTVRVRALVDSVELVGHRSLYPRDPALHHFLRGLLLSQAHEHEQAVREYRAAIWSPSEGYTRINYEMGRSLLALNRPAQAIPVLRSALRAKLDGSALYLTRTELHELAAQAFVAAGQRDSATFHYAIVERAWRSADPSLSARYDVARQWLLRSGRSVR
jgi:tetratricopeptide (TPR) repeat protein